MDVTAYHGSKTKITNFQYTRSEDAIDQNGPGMYFTSVQNEAHTYIDYRERSYIYTANLKLDKVTTNDKIADPFKYKKEVNIMLDFFDKEELEDILSNWGNINLLGLQKVRDNAVNATLLDRESTHDIFTQVWIEFYRYNEKQFVKNMADLLGYDGSIVPQTWGADTEDSTAIHYIMYNPSSIKITKEEEIIPRPLNEGNEDGKDLLFEADIISSVKNAISNINTKEEAQKLLKKIVERTQQLSKKSRIRILTMFFAAVATFASFSALESEIPDDIKQDIELVSSKANQTNNKIREITPEFIDFITHEEGSAKEKGEPVLKSYKLGDGTVTTGYGHSEKIKDSKIKDNIKPIDALVYLKQDVIEAQNALNRILNDWDAKGIPTDSIDQGKYNAMVSMIFNMGTGNFRKSNFIQLVKQNKMDLAANKILSTSITYEDKDGNVHDSNGLKKRREREQQVFQGSSQLEEGKLIRHKIRMLIREALNEYETIGVDSLRQMPDLEIDPEWAVPQVGSRNYDYDVKNGKIIFHEPDKIDKDNLDFVITQAGKLLFGVGHFKLAKKAGTIKAAGMVKMNNDGQISYIDNESGHYKPQKCNLDAAFNVLNSMGVLTKDVNANCKF